MTQTEIQELLRERASEAIAGIDMAMIQAFADGREMDYRRLSKQREVLMREIAVEAARISIQQEKFEKTLRETKPCLN